MNIETITVDGVTYNIVGSSFRGSIYFANLPTVGMSNGDWYDIKDAFTTDIRFEEGSGISCPAGTDVAWNGESLKWNILAMASNKADKVSGATNGNFAALDSNGNLKDSGHKHSDYLTQHQDISGKADKVSGATSGNFAGLDGTGNLTDSGFSVADLPIDTKVTSTDPYTFRQGKGNLADMEIVGASVAWNQQAAEGTFTNTATDTRALNLRLQAKTIGTSVVLTYTATVGVFSKIVSPTWTGESVVKHNGAIRDFTFIDPLNVVDGHKYLVSINLTGIDTSVVGGVVADKIMFIDLTLLFGSTIADAIYAMETTTAGAGVAFFRKYFPKDYYAYDAGSIQSVCVGSRKVTGKNLFDKNGNGAVFNGYISDSGVVKTSSSGEKSYICKIHAGTYTIQKPKLTTRYRIGVTTDYPTNNETVIGFVSEQVNNRIATYTSDVDGYLIIFGLNNSGETTTNSEMLEGLQVELGTTETPYEPYTETTYPFDSTKELRGLFSLEDGELKASGDKYWSRGEIQRNWLEPIDLGTLNWEATLPSSHVFGCTIHGIKKIQSGKSSKILSTKYDRRNAGYNEAYPDEDKICWQYVNSEYIRFKDSAYTDVATFKTAMSGVYLIAEKATPTTETAQPYQNPQRAYIDGTEEFIDGLTRDVMIPVGNKTTYNLNAVLPDVEDYADGVVRANSVDMTGAGASTAGAHGLVPAPAAGDQNKVLSGAGTWVPQNSSGVSSFNSRTGAVTPAAGDYNSNQVYAHGLHGITMLSSSANLNTYLAPTYSGEYYYDIAGHSISNMPSGLSGQPFRLIVESLGASSADIATGSGELDYTYANCTLQTLIVTNINNYNEVKTYRRRGYNSGTQTPTWSDWVSYEDQIAALNSGLTMDVLKEFDINSYTDGVNNVSVTVPNMDKYKIFAIGNREGLSGVGNDYSFGSSFSMIPRSIFTDKSSQTNKLTLQFAWYPDYKYNFQLKYENSTTVKVAYKVQSGSQLANFYAVFYGIKI